MKERDDQRQQEKKKEKKKNINLVSKFPLETEVDGWNTVVAQLCVGARRTREAWPWLGLMGGREKQRGEG